MKKDFNWNLFLSRVSFITTFGDFLSFFSVLYLIHKSTNSITLAAYSVPVKSLAIAMGGLTIPAVMTLVSIKNILVLTQFVSGFLISILLVYWKYAPNQNPFVILLILFLQTILKQYFESAKEAFSKALGEVHEQRTLQAQLASGLYSAQFLGPIVSFFLIRYLSIYIPIGIDMVSFFMAGILCFNLPEVIEKNRYSIFRPLTYLAKNKALLDIFILRSVGQWLALGIFNFLLFKVVYEHYKLDLAYSAWVYSMVGLGATLSALFLKHKTDKNPITRYLRKFSDSEISIFGMILYGLSIVGFAYFVSPIAGLITLFFTGIANGLNAIATQSLRRKLTTQTQFPEVVGLELVVGKLSDYFVGTLCFFAVSQLHLSYFSGMSVAAVVFWSLSAWLYLRRIEI